MRATQEILSVWNRFNSFPLETFTKAWFWEQSDGVKQRSVELMKQHRELYGSSGNCFDLSIWLLHEFSKEGIEAYAIGSNLKTPEAHVAVIAIGENGNRYLCDLGDQWISPILIDSCSNEFKEGFMTGFFPAASVKIETNKSQSTVTYLRPNGKKTKQKYSIEPLTLSELLEAGEHSQNLLRKPLGQMRVRDNDEVKYWEFDRWTSFLGTNQGLTYEEKLLTNEEWTERIHDRTGISKDIILKALNVYSKVMA